MWRYALTLQFDHFLGKRLERTQIQTSNLGQKKKVTMEAPGMHLDTWNLVTFLSCFRSILSILCSFHFFFHKKWPKPVQVSGPLLRVVFYVCFGESTHNTLGFELWTIQSPGTFINIDHWVKIAKSSDMWEALPFGSFTSHLQASVLFLFSKSWRMALVLFSW